MKNIEKIIIILIGLWLINRIYNYVFLLNVVPYLNFQRLLQIIDLMKLVTPMQLIVFVLVQAGIGIWLFQLARREGRSRWIWGLFGLTFGISAAILYFLMQLVGQVKLR